MEPGGFVNREKEVLLLTRAWAKRPSFVVIYGRRRIGKTRLLREWVRKEGLRHVYYFAHLSGHAPNLAGLARALDEVFGTKLSGGRWESLYHLLATAASALRDGDVIILDEFSYWVRSAPQAASELQQFVDEVLPQTGLVLIITGSLVGVMLRDILGGSAPLYGRATHKLRLRELSPWCIKKFAPRYSPRELVETYSLFGGVPHYLRLLDDSLTPFKAFTQLFGPGGDLEGEPYFIIREEFRDPHPYLAILEAVAAGNTTLTRIANYAGLPASHTSKYVRILTQLGLLERVPVLFSKRAPIRVADKALRSYLSLSRALHSLSQESPQLREKYAALVSLGWEELSSAHATTHLAREMGITPSAAGKLIHKGTEVDWAIIDNTNKKILAIEAKWSDLSEADIRRIARRVKAATYTAFPSSIKDYDTHVAIYTRSAPEHVKEAEIITPEDMPWGKECTS